MEKALHLRAKSGAILLLNFFRAVQSFFCAEEISFKTPQIRERKYDRSVRLYRIYGDKIWAPHYWTIYGMIRTATAATAAAAAAAAAAVAATAAVAVC